MVLLWLWCKGEELLICMYHACMNAGILLAAGVTQNATRVKGVMIGEEQQEGSDGHCYNSARPVDEQYLHYYSEHCVFL